MSTLPMLEVHGGSTLRGALAITLEHTANWTSADVDQMTAVIEAFVVAGGLGGYRGKPPGTAASSLTVAGAPLASGSSFQVAMIAENVDARAFQYLRHMTGHLDFGKASVGRILVLQQSPSGPVKTTRFPPIDNANEEDLYPDPVDPQPFHVDWAETGPSKTRRVEIELGSPVANVHVDHVSRIAESWGALLEGAAFCLPFGYPNEVDAVMGSVSQFDAYAIEIEVAVYQGSEAGWDVLMNMLASATGAALPIRQVTVE